LKKEGALFFVLIFIISVHSVIAQFDPNVASVINQVSSDHLMDNLNYLTGIKEVTVPSGTFLITSRHSDQFTNKIAEEYLKQRLESFGLTTTMQYFDGGGGNVIATQPGYKYPQKQIIICAHFDNMPNSFIAPGADDNASGTSAVLEAAKILSKMKTDYTIIYALWDKEEQGLLGSAYYAYLARSRNDDIIAVINMDMIGWDSNNDNIAEIHYRNYSTSFSIADNMFKVNSTYQIGMNLEGIYPGTSASDHASFWNNNYPAVLLIEDYTFSNGFRDFNTKYHTADDKIDLINRSYFEKCAKLAIGTLATYAGIQTTSSVKIAPPLTYSLMQNYPNPFNSATTISYQLEKESHVKIVVYDLIGKEVTALVDRVQLPGSYSVYFDPSNYNGGLSAGLYFYTMYSKGFASSRKMIYLK
jgi:hypothetical protein